MSAFTRCLRAEWTKHWRQGLPWVGLAAAALAGILAVGVYAQVVPAVAGGSPVPRNAFRFFALGFRYGIATGTFFLVLVAGLSVAGEAGQGTLKMVLVRPVRRREVFLAKAGVLFVYTLILLLVVGGACFLTADLMPRADYGPVVDPEYSDPANPYIYAEAAEMWGHLGRAVLLVVLPLLAAAAFGLTVSVLGDNPGVAAGAALVSFLFLELLKALLEGQEAARWLFNEYLPTFLDHSYVGILRGRAEGLSDAVWPGGLWVLNVGAPLVFLVVLLLFGGWVFGRKGVLT